MAPWTLLDYCFPGHPALATADTCCHWQNNWFHILLYYKPCWKPSLFSWSPFIPRLKHLGFLAPRNCKTARSNHKTARVTSFLGRGVSPAASAYGETKKPPADTSLWLGALHARLPDCLRTADLRRCCLPKAKACLVFLRFQSIASKLRGDTSTRILHHLSPLALTLYWG